MEWCARIPADNLPDMWISIPSRKTFAADLGRWASQATSVKHVVNGLSKRSTTTRKAELGAFGRHLDEVEWRLVCDVPKGLKIGLVDDLKTTGSTLHGARDYLESHGYEVTIGITLGLRPMRLRPE